MIKFYLILLIPIIACRDPEPSNVKRGGLPDHWIITNVYSPSSLITEESNFLQSEEARGFVSDTVVVSDNYSKLFGVECDTVGLTGGKYLARNHFFYTYRCVRDTSTGYGTTGVNSDSLGIRSDSVWVSYFTCGKLSFDWIMDDSCSAVLVFKGNFFRLRCL